VRNRNLHLKTLKTKKIALSWGRGGGRGVVSQISGSFKLPPLRGRGEKYHRREVLKCVSM